MKKQTIYRAAVSVLFLLCVSLRVHALSVETLMTIQVPFDFQVNEKLLPAGKYVIKRDPQMPNLLQIECPERKILVIVNTLPYSFPEKRIQTRTSMMFKEYGEKHFLSEVKLSGYGFGFSLIESKDERKLAKAAKANTILNSNSAND